MKQVTEVFLGSFTGKTEKEQKKILKKAREENLRAKFKVAISPSIVTKEWLKMLKEYEVKTVELEVQSTNSYILKKCGYLYGIEDIKKACKMLKWKGFKISCQIGVGLPDSTKLDELNTAKDIAKLKPNSVRIYPMLVVKNTKLEDEYKNGEYDPLSVSLAVERCKDIVYVFNRAKIKNISIVRQKDLNTNEENEIIAGPYHVEFAQLVTDSIWYDSIVEKIKKFNVKVRKVKVEVNPKELPNVMGYENENANKLMELYNVEIKAEGNPDIKMGKSKIDVIEVFSN